MHPFFFMHSTPKHGAEACVAVCNNVQKQRGQNNMRNDLQAAFESSYLQMVGATLALGKAQEALDLAESQEQAAKKAAKKGNPKALAAYNVAREARKRAALDYAAKQAALQEAVQAKEGAIKRLADFDLAQQEAAWQQHDKKLGRVAEQIEVKPEVKIIVTPAKPYADLRFKAQAREAENKAAPKPHAAKDAARKAKQASRQAEADKARTKDQTRTWSKPSKGRRS